jgi:hypothetical protein
MPSAARPSGRVTPKGVRPAARTTRDRRDRPGTTFDRSNAHHDRPPPDRRSAARASVVRTGHRGGR